MNLAGPCQVRADTEDDVPMRRNDAMAGPSRLETRRPPGLEGSMWRQQPDGISMGEVDSMSYSQLVMVVKMLQMQMAEAQRQLEELIARVNSRLKGTGDTRSWAQVARGKKYNERVIIVLVGYKTEVVIWLGARADPVLKHG